MGRGRTCTGAFLARRGRLAIGNARIKNTGQINREANAATMFSWGTRSDRRPLPRCQELLQTARVGATMLPKGLQTMNPRARSAERGRPMATTRRLIKT